MSYTSYDELRKASHTRTLEKQEVHDGLSVVKGVAKILEMEWTRHTPASSANNFAKLSVYKSYMNQSPDLLAAPFNLRNYDDFNKDVGCDIKLKNNGITETTLTSFYNTLKLNHHGRDDLIEACKGSTSSPSSEMTYCSNQFFDDIVSHFLPLAGLCNQENHG